MLVEAPILDRQDGVDQTLGEARQPDGQAILAGPVCRPPMPGGLDQADRLGLQRRAAQTPPRLVLEAADLAAESEPYDEGARRVHGESVTERPPADNPEPRSQPELARADAAIRRRPVADPEQVLFHEAAVGQIADRENRRPGEDPGRRVEHRVGEMGDGVRLAEDQNRTAQAQQQRPGQGTTGTRTR